MSRALITGSSGFVGTHLVTHLQGIGWQIYGFDRRTSDAGEYFFTGDIADRDSLQNVLRECQPDVIFHLAGLIKSNLPETIYQANLLGTVSLFESLTELGQRPVVVVASSSAVYGPGFSKRPVTEKFKPHPVTHYAVSKLAQEIASIRFFDAFYLPVMIVRTFNLLGPGQNPDLACSAFARQIALAERQGSPSAITTGDLSAQRDFVDVRDAVRAYLLLAEKGQAGKTYNVASGRAVSIRECLDFLRKQARVPIKAVLDPARLQKNDVPIQIGSAKRLQKQTGWEPEISTEQSLLDLLNDWRQKLGTE